MRKQLAATCAGIIAVVSVTFSFAGTDTYFNPLTQSSAVASPNHINELNSPWQAPAGISQYNLTSLKEIEADVDQSIVRASGWIFGATFGSMIDMVAYDPTGNYLFLPHETPSGAGLSRYDILNDKSVILFQGDSQGEAGDWSNDYAAFDPARWTPNGTVIMGEEWSGGGRVFEVLNPMADPADIEVRELHSIANTFHEGLFFSEEWPNKVLYFIDEDNSGSLYKIVFSKKGDYTKGQTFVLAVDAFQGDPAASWNAAANLNAERTGKATWVPLTDKKGVPLTEIDPFENTFVLFGPRNGRLAADEVNATPYGRLEDVELARNNKGNEMVYFAATSENRVYSVEMLDSKKAMVRVFVSRDTPKNAGFPATTGTLDSPDNLAQDALGNIYVIEDSPNSGNVGGDIWFARDVDNDGVAESLDHFLSIQVSGSEATGMIFNPVNPVEFVVAVQHPDSTDLANVPNGFGDSLWSFDLSGVVPPTCKKHSKVHWGKIRTCSNDSDYQFINMLEWAGHKHKHPHWKK